MEHKAFIIYKSHCSIVKRLTNEQKWKLFQQIIDYNETWEIYEEDIMVLMAFDFMKVNFDIDRQKYEEKCRINAENGRNGGKAKASKTKRPLATASKIKRSPPKEEEKEDEDVNEYENEIEKENKKILEIKIESLPFWTARNKFYSFLLEHLEYISDKIDIEKIDNKLSDFQRNLWDERAKLELESFCEHHRNEKTLFKSIIWRLNTWLSNKIWK